MLHEAAHRRHAYLQRARQLRQLDRLFRDDPAIVDRRQEIHRLGEPLLAQASQWIGEVAVAPIPVAPGIFGAAVTPVAGIAASEMTPAQRRLLEKLIDVYTGRVAPEVAKARLDALQKAGFDKITFGWAGVTEVGGPHYYRVQGPSFLIEYDNTQNNGNHIHSVWRDFNGDFGRDLLPKIVGSTRTMAYNFQGYWADVGTVESFYEANVMLGRPMAPFGAPFAATARIKSLRPTSKPLPCGPLIPLPPL